MLTVIVPASNEEKLIGQCLDALLASRFAPARRWQLIVAANGCRDRTVPLARGYADRAKAANVDLVVLDIERGDKLNAINVAEEHATGDIRVYIDADVVVEPDLLAQLQHVLGRDQAAYATGSLRIAPPATWATRNYARFWSRLPFVVDGVAGCGVFAVNAVGRARWERFPPIISDDTFVRLHFAPSERFGVAAGFTWPMVEGFSNLVRVRRRQDRGVAEIVERYPELLANEGKSRADLKRLAIADPFGFSLYSLVAMATRLPNRSAHKWVRGR